MTYGYKQKEFNKDELFREKYGTNASWWDKLAFNRYWNSDQREADELAHIKSEIAKSNEYWDGVVQKAINRTRGIEEPPAPPVVPSLYKQQDFKQTKMTEMFGTDPSKRDQRRFKRYINSDQGQQDWMSFSAAEHAKYMKSVDDVTNHAIQRMRQAALGGPTKASMNMEGGSLNKINYFQQGGAAPKQDIKAQVTALVQAAMQGDQKATQQVNQIMEAAKAGDQQAIQIAQIMEQVIKELQGQATSAKWGTKLGYIKSLKYAKGGKTCPACEKGKQVEMKACGGKKAKKRYFGGLI